MSALKSENAQWMGVQRGLCSQHGVSCLYAFCMSICSYIALCLQNVNESSFVNKIFMVMAGGIWILLIEFPSRACSGIPVNIEKISFFL